MDKNQNLIHIPLLTLLALTGASGLVSKHVNAEEPSRWQLKSGVLLVDTDKAFSFENDEGSNIYAGGNAQLGAMVGLEYRWSELVGLEFGFGYAKSPDLKQQGSSGEDSLGDGPAFAPTYVGANFYLWRTDSVEFYAGPRVAYASFSDFKLDVGEETKSFKVSNEFSWGATAGVSYQLPSSRWSMVAEATYLQLDREVSERGPAEAQTASLDPVMVNLGVSYKF